MTEDQHRFVEDMGQTFVSWALPRNTGRVYAYLLLQSRPATLDQIATDLEIAKSGASVASRQLVAVALARASGERGSRRHLYEALHTLEGVFAARSALLREFIGRVRQGARAANDELAAARMDEMAAVIQEFEDEIPVLIRRIRDRRSAS